VIVTVLLFALRILAVLFLVRLVLRWLASLTGPPPRREARDASRTQIASDLVRDRICNTFLPRERAVHAVVAGREEHFCSATCRDRAQAAASGTS
jgi:hypothetical protein